MKKVFFILLLLCGCALIHHFHKGDVVLYNGEYFTFVSYDPFVGSARIKSSDGWFLHVSLDSLKKEE
jgi:hypothetical protein